MARINRIWKMYIFFSFVTILAMALAGFVLQKQLKRKLHAHMGDDVLTLAKALAEALPEDADPVALPPWCSAYARATGVRITVVDTEGRVICDSTEERIVGVDHLDRPEVQEALRLGSATAVRFSATAGEDMLYAALFAREKGKIIRLSLHMSQVKTIENEVMAFFVAAIFLSPFLSVVIALLFVKRLVSEPDGLQRT